MPWPETTVPKFGDWDGNEDLSYSIVFDKARADKERFLPTLKDGSKDTPLHQQRYETPGLTAGKIAPHTFLNKTVESGSRIPAHGSPKLSSRHGGRTSADEQRNSNNIQVDPWNSSDKGSVYNSSMPSSGQQPTQIGLTKETKAKEMGVRNNGSHVGAPHQAFYGGMHRIPGPERQTHQEYPAAPKSTRSQRSSESSSTANMPEKIVVPRFGEWDASDAKAGEGFTMIFNRARDEKKSKTPLKTPTRFISPHRPDEDLYKDSQARKKKGGWLNTLCCVDIDGGKG